MFRSRIELADTLGEVEKDRQKHDGDMTRAEERAKELEAALCAGDEVWQKASITASCAVSADHFLSCAFFDLT